MRAGILAIALVASAACFASEPPSADAIPPPGAPSCDLFPANSFYHADVRSLPVHPRSDQWIRAMGGRSQPLHPDFGPSDDPDRPYGIPYDVVGASHQDVSIDFLYADESDPGPYPFGPDITIENGSDRHALMLDRDACVLYELFDARWNGGDPKAGSGAIFDLDSNALRPSGWTSADAGGFSILAALIRRDEVETGVIDHVIRVTTERTDDRFIWPARHRAGAARDASLPPMGAWFRMRKGYDITGFLPETRVVLRAMKVHGLVLADNGSNFYFTGAAEEGWIEAVLDELKSVRAGAFVAVDTRPMRVDPNSGQVAPPYVGG